MAGVPDAAVCRVHDVGEVDGLALPVHGIRGRGGPGFPDPPDPTAPRKTRQSTSLANCRGPCRRAREGRAAPRPEAPERDARGTGRVRITAFGLAGLAETIQGDHVGSGTPPTFPAATGGTRRDPRSDVFALGLVLYDVHRSASLPGPEPGLDPKQHEQSSRSSFRFGGGHRAGGGSRDPALPLEPDPPAARPTLP